MRMISKVLVAVCLVALAFGSVSAQEPKQRGQRGQPGRGGFGGGMMGGGGMAMLLANPSVQEELKLTDDQKKTVKEKTDEMRQKGQDLREKLQGLSPEERREKGMAMAKAASAESTTMAKDVLKPDQFTRLQQIAWQNNVLGTLTTDEEVQTKLHLTAEQKDKLKTIGDDMQKDMQAIFQDAQGDRQGMQTKMTALRKETTTKTVETLTDDQKKTWKDMVGKPFEVKPEPRRRDT